VVAVASDGGRLSTVASDSGERIDDDNDNSRYDSSSDAI